MRAWLTTVVSRICLDMLRARQCAPRGARRRLAPGADRHRPRVRAIPSTRRCSPIPSVWRCWWCSRRSRRPSAWRSCCTTCSGCRSRRSRRSSSATCRRRGSSRAEHVGGSGAPASHGRRASISSARSSRRSSTRHATAISRHCWRCSIPDVVFRGEGGVGGPPVPEEVRGAEDVAHLVLARGTPTAPLGRPAIVNGRPGAVVCSARSRASRWSRSRSSATASRRWTCSSTRTSCGMSGCEPSAPKRSRRWPGCGRRRSPRPRRRRPRRSALPRGRSSRRTRRPPAGG